MHWSIYSTYFETQLMQVAIILRVLWSSNQHLDYAHNISYKVIYIWQSLAIFSWWLVCYKSILFSWLIIMQQNGRKKYWSSLHQNVRSQTGCTEWHHSWQNSAVSIHADPKFPEICKHSHKSPVGTSLSFRKMGLYNQ